MSPGHFLSIPQFPNKPVAFPQYRAGGGNLRFPLSMVKFCETFFYQIFFGITLAQKGFCWLRWAEYVENAHSNIPFHFSWRFWPFSRGSEADRTGWGRRDSYRYYGWSFRPEFDVGSTGDRSDQSLHLFVFRYPCDDLQSL